MTATILPRENQSRGYAIALISAFILSTTAIFIRHLTQTYQIPSLVLAFWRDSFVVITLLPILGLLRAQLLRIERRHISYLVAYGFVLAIFNSLWIKPTNMNPGQTTCGMKSTS